MQTPHRQTDRQDQDSNQSLLLSTINHYPASVRHRQIHLTKILMLEEILHQVLQQFLKKQVCLFVLLSPVLQRGSRLLVHGF